MTSFTLSPAARRDLTGIWFYTADQWGVDQANLYNEQIEAELGRAADGLRVAQRIGDFWKIRSGRHLCIFYRSADGGISVIRILHERMDIEAWLGE